MLDGGYVLVLGVIWFVGGCGVDGYCVVVEWCCNGGY